MRGNNVQGRAARVVPRLLIAAAIVALVGGCGGTASTGGGTTPVDPGSSPPPPPPPPPGGAPSLSFTANPSSVANGGSTTLSWSTANVSSCTASGAWSGAIATSGSRTVGPLTTSNTYVLSCSGANGTVTRSVTVTVGSPPLGSTVVSLQMQDQSGAPAGNIPVTFGQVFAPSHVPSGATLAARTTGSSSVNVPVQVDAKARHADGSLRHAVITARLPTLSANGTLTLELVSSAAGSSSGPVQLSELLATTFDATVALDIGGAVYQASARQLLEAGPVQTWLAGPMVTEWIVAAPLRNAAGTAHPHLAARFNVRAYAGMDSVRVDVIVENAWALASNPTNYTYNVTVSIAGKGTVLAQNAVTHYRQARWRRVFWWGTEPRVHVRHDRAYLQNSGVVPTYDPAISVSESTLASLYSTWNSNSALMGIGVIDPYMPGVGGRPDIGPLPSWTALYLITQDPRARTVTLGSSEQAGSFGIHYRDAATGLPISIDTYPNATINGAPFFPACGGTCSTPYTPDAAHQPSLSYVPYLVTGDEYHLEELHFWANWNLMENGDHGGSLGLLSGNWAQMRATAWSLRTVGHAAFITPDAHPLKSYFVAKLNNNIDWFTNTYVTNPPTPLGYAYTRSGPSASIDTGFAPWQNDFLTWTVGHLVNLGFSNARPFLDYQARFAVGRMLDPGYCWILASTYWTPQLDGSGNLFQTWADYRRAVIQNWVDSFRGTNSLTSAQVQQLIDAPCNSSTMANLLGLQIGEMIGYSSSNVGYPSNLQPALAVAKELGALDADQAWNLFMSRSVRPDYSNQPQYGIVPRAP